jgi:hypothetical protein
VSLDVPFSLQLAKSLMQLNVDVQPNLQVNDLVEQI